MGYFPNPLGPLRRKKKVQEGILNPDKLLKERLTKTAFFLLWRLDLSDFLFEETNTIIMVFTESDMDWGQVTQQGSLAKTGLSIFVLN